jgi:hypothetical protein
MADSEGRGEGIAIRHQGDLVCQVQEAQEVLGLAVKFFDDLEGQFDLMARHYPNNVEVSAYFKTLYPDPDEGNPSRAQNVRDGLFRLFESGKGQDIPEIKSTTWAALNAVTEYVDHHRPTRAKSIFDRAANRLELAWFGSGSRLKQQAFQLAIQMAATN